MPSGVNLNGFAGVIIRNKGVLGVKGDTVFDFNMFNPTIYGPALMDSEPRGGTEAASQAGREEVKSEASTPISTR